MALFKAKQQNETPAFDPDAFKQQLSTEFAAYVQSALAPIVTAVQALGQGRQQPPPQEDDEGQQSQQRPTQQGLTAEQVRQMFREEQQTQNSIPKNRMQALRQFRNTLTADGRELFDRYGDEVERVIDEIAPQHQGNPQAWEQAFRFSMINNHEKEYVDVLLKDAKPEDLPPHLQQPVGQGGGQAEPGTELNEDEKVIQPIFDRSYKGGFTPKQMREYGDLNSNFSMTMDQMIAAAKEKGLIANGTEANKGNNA